MFKTTTKSLILISLFLAFAMALQDGDQIAFRTHATPYHAEYQYLNAYVSDGSLHMAASTDYNTLSGTWWEAHKLSDGSWAFENLGDPHNAQYMYLDANTYTGAVALKSTTNYPFTGTHWSVETLSDGTVGLKTLSEHVDPNLMYLDVNVWTGGSLALKSTTDYPFTGTHWEIVTLVPAGTGLGLVDFNYLIEEVTPHRNPPPGPVSCIVQC